ncbi:hypothetical protein L0F63_006793 [Massospora cicadina]|nr:hypothetical protein L0F63_006793 [Massospora cicadina]
MFATTDLNVQFGCCFAVFLIWVLCLAPVRYAQSRTPGGLDNSNPRQQYSEMAGYGQRALYAHNNTLEGFVFFAFALIANQFGNGNPSGASVLAVIYTICRTIYVPLYILNFASLRSAVWLASLICVIALFILPFAS